MATLSEESYRAIVDAIYEAALAPALWLQVVERLTEALGAIGGTVYTPAAVKIGLEPVWATNADPEFIAAYASRYAHTDIISEAVMRRIPKTSFVYSVLDLISREKFTSWDAYVDLLKPRGVEQGIGLVVCGDDHRLTQLVMLFPELSREAVQEIQRVMERFEGHFAQAMRVHWHLSAARQEMAGARYTLDQFQTGVAWLSATGEVLYRNAEMDRLLASRDGLSLAAGKLRASNRAETEMIQEAVGAAQRGEERSFAITRHSDEDPYRLRVVPLPLQASALRLPNAAAIAFVSDTRAPSAAIIEAFAGLHGLSPAERRLLEPIAGGADLRAAAETTGVGYETARSHFKSIMAKSKVNRHADLIRLLATTPAPIS
jgi:DNA-binding CsgD family transcriptional regulator